MPVDLGIKNTLLSREQSRRNLHTGYIQLTTAAGQLMSLEYYPKDIIQ